MGTPEQSGKPRGRPKGRRTRPKEEREAAKEAVRVAAEQRTGKKRGRPKGVKTRPPEQRAAESAAREAAKVAREQHAAAAATLWNARRNPSIVEYTSEIDGKKRFVVAVPYDLKPSDDLNIPNLETKTSRILEKLAALRRSVQNNASVYRKNHSNIIKNKLDILAAESQAARIALRDEETELKRLARANPEHIRTDREKWLMAGKLNSDDKKKKLDAALQAIEASIKQKNNALNAAFSAERRAFEEELKTGNALRNAKLAAINEKRDAYTRLLQTKRRIARRQSNVHQQQQIQQQQQQQQQQQALAREQALVREQTLAREQARKETANVRNRIAREAAARQNASAANQRAQIARKETDQQEMLSRSRSRGQKITELLDTLRTGTLNKSRQTELKAQISKLMAANKTNMASMQLRTHEIAQMKQSLTGAEAIATALRQGDQRGRNQKSRAAIAARAAREAPQQRQQ